MTAAHKIIIRSTKEDSAFLYQLLEAHEGWAAYSTLPFGPHDPYRDLQLIVPDDWKNEVMNLLESLKERVMILSNSMSND
jgi:hypothetical protein